MTLNWYRVGNLSCKRSAPVTVPPTPTAAQVVHCVDPIRRNYVVGYPHLYVRAPQWAGCLIVTALYHNRLKMAMIVLSTRYKKLTRKV